MAENLQAATQAPHSVHLAMSITALRSAMRMAPKAQAFTQSVQPVHFSRWILMEAITLPPL